MIGWIALMNCNLVDFSVCITKAHRDLSVQLEVIEVSNIKCPIVMLHLTYWEASAKLIDPNDMSCTSVGSYCTLYSVQTGFKMLFFSTMFKIGEG